jgi:hypothetical protein
MGLCGLDSSGSGQGPVERSCEHSNAPLGSITCYEIPEWLRNWWLFKKDSLQGVSLLEVSQLYSVLLMQLL